MWDGESVVSETAFGEICQFKDSAELRGEFEEVLFGDKAATTRVVYLTNKLFGIAYLTIVPVICTSASITNILERGLELGASGYVVIDHYIFGRPSGYSFDRQTQAYRRAGRNSQLHLLDHIVVVGKEWFGQTFQRGIAVPISRR